MAEVPVVFPSEKGSPHRFLVNDAICTIKRYEASKRCSADAKKAPLLDDVSALAIQCGSASVSCLSFQASGLSTILTTSVLMENPRVLSVALGGNSPNSPVIVELDLASEVKTYGITVKVQAFVEEREGQECIRLVLVGDNAVVLTIRLRPGNLAPLDGKDCLEIFKVRDLLNDDPATREAVSGSLIHKTMVAFYSPTRVVMALSPLLLSIDLKGRTCEIWLESQCLEDMKARSSTIGSIFSKASEILLGRLDDGSLVDMAPCASLCVSSTGDPLLDPTYVFTLHSDGKLKRWTVSDDVLRPIEVYPIAIDMPNPRDWADFYHSVYLCARLYSQVYVLAVHIQTSAASQLFAVYGCKDHKVQEGLPSKLDVPSEVVGLVDMDFDRNSNSCSLTAMFRANTDDQYGTPTTITAVYPHSVVSIISTQPEVSPIGYFVDGVAQSERARIGALVFCDELDGGETSTLSLDDEIHEMDCRFMKYLFRPAYPRGSGTVTAPRDCHIQRAIQNVVYGGVRPAKHDGASQSIQLETLRAMHEWRTRENLFVFTSSLQKTNRSTSESTGLVKQASTTKTTAMSVYDSYVGDALDDREEVDVMELSDSDVSKIERERVFLLKMHLLRWRRLLLAIWDEEQPLRLPLGLFLLANCTRSCTVIIRSGFTSILAGIDVGSSGHALVELDRAAVRLIESLESQDDSCRKLIGLEQRVWNNLAKAQLDETTPSDFAEGFSKVVDSAFDSHSAEGELFSALEQKQLVQSLGKIPIEDYFVLLQDTPWHEQLPGLNLIDPSQGSATRTPTTSGNIAANCQVRLSVCALSVRCMDSSRRLLLGRYLLVSYLGRSSHISLVAFYAYLRVLAVMWVGSQGVPMPAAFAGSSSAREWGELPPKEGLSFGDSSNSILANSSQTTCMDALLISILQSTPNSHELSPIDLVLALAQELFCSSMRSTVLPGSSVSSGRLSQFLPELGALPPPASQVAAADNPRLALRLIAPLAGLDSGTVAPNVILARKETLAECLLVESQQKQLPEGLKSKLRIKACELLASSSFASGNTRNTLKAFNFLKNRTSQQQLSEGAIQSLAKILQQLIHRDRGAVRWEIRRLVEMETAQTLCGCLVYDAQDGIPSDVNQALNLLLPRLQHLSNLMHHVQILAFHVSKNNIAKSKSSNEFVLQFINNAIRDVNSSFPIEVCLCMPEYLSLYDCLFHIGMSSREWNQAYDACANNPSLERKVGNFKLLVNSMVDAGALGELMCKCSSLASGIFTRESIDLYSIAADAMEEGCSRDLYLVRANASDASKAAPDYQGSLYSLHASQGQWRRAAQALDQRYVNAMCSLASSPHEHTEMSNTDKVRERLIVEDLVLASVGAANAASLVDDRAAQFIVSGEQGQMPFMQVNSCEAASSTAKCGVNSGTDTCNETSSLNRISQFMTMPDLHGRAAWSCALRKLCLDNSASFTMHTSSLLDEGNPCMDHEALKQLCFWGYYFNCLLLALAMSKTASKGGCKAFHDSLCGILSQALLPVSYSYDFNNTKSRPSISQLCRPLDGIGAPTGSVPLFVGCRFKSSCSGVQTCLQKLGEKLVQKLFMLHAGAENPVGLLVASCVLEFDNKIAQLPCWLEQLMVRGTPNAKATLCYGLFKMQQKAGHVPAYLGDWTALLSLYLHHGMLVEACDVAVEALSSSVVGDERWKARLPEKGDILFVPYKKIDILWNLIDNALGKSGVDEETKFKLRNGQGLLIDSLEKHLHMMKHHEGGLRSARALAHQQNFLA